MNLNEKFKSLQNELGSEILERKDEIHTSILSILSQRHHVQIGPPGTAKSLLVSRLAKRIEGLGNHGYFHWLLTPYTTPEELYGPPRIPELKAGIYRRNTQGKLPEASIAFIDEIFKANSAILNTKLTIMNERLFMNGPNDDPNVPLISMFSASNELPQGEELDALWDRFHFRHFINPLQEASSFMKMMKEDMVENPEPVISLSDIYEAHQAVSNVKITSDIYKAINTLKKDLKAEGIEPTERRWKQSIAIIQAEAFFNGRDHAEIVDMRPLMHVLWTDMTHVKAVRSVILNLANPIDKESQELLDSLIKLDLDFKKALEDSDNPKQAASQAIETHKKLVKTKAQIDKLKDQCANENKTSEVLDSLVKKFQQVANTLLTDGFNVSVDNL
jgi:MoxR-like ATPase